MSYEDALLRATQKSPHSDSSWKAIRFSSGTRRKLHLTADQSCSRSILFMLPLFLVSRACRSRITAYEILHTIREFGIIDYKEQTAAPVLAALADPGNRALLIHVTENRVVMSSGS